MRTTVTLDPDVAAQIQRDMRERGVSFKQALNDAVRSGATGGESRQVPDFPSYDMGEPAMDITKAVALAGEFEDDELRRRLAQGR
jgi:hypothetical protein